MGFFDIEKQGPGYGIFAVGNGIKGGSDAVDNGALDLVGVLIEKTETENAEGIGIGVELLDDQVVVFTGFDVGTVFADSMGNGFIALFVFLFHGLDPGKLFGAAFHGQLDKGVPGAGGRRRSEHFNLDTRQRSVDVLPGFVRVGNQFLTAIGVRHILGQRHENVLTRDFHDRGFFRVGQHDAVVTNLDLDNFRHAVLGAFFAFRLFYAAGRIGDIRMLDAHTGAKEFKSSAGAGRFDFRGFIGCGFAELLGHYGGKRVDRRRTDNADVVTRRPGCGKISNSRKNNSCCQSVQKSFS